MFVTIAALMLAQAAPVDTKAAKVALRAVRADFETCDGFRAPSGKSDGISPGAGLGTLFFAQPTQRRNQSAVGGAAGEACDRALASALLLPEHGLRRANLLQARAMHQLSDGANAAALETIAKSDAAGGSDPFFMDSVRQGNRALRAVALFRLDRKAEARAEADAIRAHRPWAATQRSLSHQVRLMFENDPAQMSTMLTDQIPYNPDLMTPLFWMSMLYGDHADAVRYGRQVSFDLPRGRGGWTMEGETERPYLLIGKRADLGGALAYALLASGQGAQADAALAEARAEVDAAIQPPPTPPDGRKIGKRKQADYQSRIVAGQVATSRLDMWMVAMALRREAPTLTLAQLTEKLAQPAFRQVPVVPDLLKQVGRATPEERATLPQTIAALDAQFDTERRGATTLKFEELAKLLPRPEMARMRPSFGKADAILLSGNNGFSVKPHTGTQSLTVRYGSDNASAAMVEELALLAAAEQARRAGKAGFLIESRVMVERTTSISSMYGGSTFPSGYEAQLKILPVDAGALPAGMEAAKWRVLDAGAVQAALASKYASAVR